MLFRSITGAAYLRLLRFFQIELTVRPFNRFDLDAPTNDWWLVPSTEWPAYKFGKLFFNTKLPTAAADSRSIFCGFYVERGLGPAASAAGYDPSWIIGKDWLWDEFVGSAARIFPQLPNGAFVTIQAPVPPPPGSNKNKLDVLKMVSGASFSVESGGKLKLEKSDFSPASPKIEDHFRKAILSATEMSQVGAALSQLPEPDFTWLDLCIGVLVSSQSHGQSVWSQYLRFWRPWLRSAVSSGRK